MTLFDTLRAECSREWHAYIRHDFVERLGSGDLPLPAFQSYLVQDYLFLVQFARANALAAYKSRTIADLRSAHAALGTILTETDLHVRLTESWGIERQALEAAPEEQATVAYTRYVLDCGMTGTVLDLQVALAPCVIGYAEIGRNLSPRLEDHEDHPYREWIAEYAGEAFQQGAREATDALDHLSGGQLAPGRLDELVTIFRTATRLEADFWQQALDNGRSPSA